MVSLYFWSDRIVILTFLMFFFSVTLLESDLTFWRFCKPFDVMLQELDVFCVGKIAVSCEIVWEIASKAWDIP